MITQIIKELKLKSTDIIFLYKGGTTLKIIYDKYKDIFQTTGNINFFDDLQTYFKRSDSDYVIMINPFTENFEYIYAKICYNTTNLLNLIRNFIKTISITEKIIKKSNITLDILRQTDIKLNETIQNIKRNEIKNKICTEYNNIENVIGIGYVHSNNDVVLYNPLSNCKERTRAVPTIFVDVGAAPIEILLVKRTSGGYV